MMRAPNKQSRIPVFTTLHQNYQTSNQGYSGSRGYSGAPVNGGQGPVRSIRYNSSNSSAGETGEAGSSVRNFFKERRHVDESYPLQDIKHHYNQFKGQTSPTRAKPPPALRQMPHRAPVRSHPPPPQQQSPAGQSWNRSKPLPALHRRHHDVTDSPPTRENSSSSGTTDNGRMGERALTIEELQRKEDQDRIIALIASKEEELKSISHASKQKKVEDQRQRERDRIRRSKPRVKPVEWQDPSPESPEPPPRKWSSEEENLEVRYDEPPMPRKAAHVRRRSGRGAQEPEPGSPPRRDEPPPARRGYRREVPVSPQEQRQPTPPPREPTPPPPPRRKPPPPKKRAAASPSQRKTSPAPPRVAAVTYDVPLDAAYEPPASLVPCSVCGRSFAEERIEKHRQACAKADKAHAKRKVFDPVKMRTQGTEAAQYVNAPKHKEPPAKPKKDWRKAHDELIKTLRYNKQMSEYEKGGGNLADLPPPPPTEHPDYVTCPHCARKFNEGAAERHIPRCKETKNRGKPPPQRGGKRR